jgi:hypothetical protein
MSFRPIPTHWETSKFEKPARTRRICELSVVTLKNGSLERRFQRGGKARASGRMGEDDGEFSPRRMIIDCGVRGCDPVYKCNVWWDGGLELVCNLGEDLHLSVPVCKCNKQNEHMYDPCPPTSRKHQTHLNRPN